MYPRNGIEGTLSELVRGHGLRRTKYRGINRVRLSHYMMGAACNIKRYLNLKAFEMKTLPVRPLKGWNGHLPMFPRLFRGEFLLLERFGL